jgi:hypothetical protein
MPSRPARPRVQFSPEHQLLVILSPPQAEEVTSLDWDTIKRNHPDKVIKLSPRREGIRVGDPFSLRYTPNKKAAP